LASGQLTNNNQNIWSKWHSENTPITIGVSKCLIGEKVRYDGNHARNSFVADTLNKWVEFTPVCPEADLGMGIPRPTIRLEKQKNDIKLICPSTNKDYSKQMNNYGLKKVKEFKKNELDGYIFKRSSPSCGINKLKVFRDDGSIERTGIGFFAKNILEQFPNLPIEDEGRLSDPQLRENFIERIFCHNRWRNLKNKGLTIKRLVEFHTVHKLLLRAHNETAYRRLGKIVGSAKTISNKELFKSYEDEFYKALLKKTTKKNHANVLYHALGYLKKQLNLDEKQRLIDVIEEYRTGILPLIVPLSLFNYQIMLHDIKYLKSQLYFNPHPKELNLKNHV